MAAVEGIQDKMIDVNQKHVQLSSDGDKLNKADLTNGKTTEKSDIESKMDIDIKMDDGDPKPKNDTDKDTPGNDKDTPGNEDIKMIDCDGMEMSEPIVKCMDDNSDKHKIEESRKDISIEQKKNPVEANIEPEKHANDKPTVTPNLQNGICNVNSNESDMMVSPSNNIVSNAVLSEQCDAVNTKSSTFSESLKPENLLKKLGFDPLNKISLENLCKENCESAEAVKNKSINIDKVVKDVKERLINEETSDGKSNNSSRSSSPGFVMNGVCNDKESDRKCRLAEQKLLIASLKEDLRNEESQLLLLRKLMESQTSKRNGPMILHKTKENSNRHVNMPSLHPKSRLPGQGYPSNQQDGNPSSIQIAPKIVIGSKGSSVGANLPRVVPSIVSAGKPSTGSVVTTSVDTARVTYAQLHGSVPSTAVMTQPGHRYYIQVGSQLVPAAPPSCINQPLYAMPSYSSATSTTTKPKVTISNNSSVASSKLSSQPVNSLDTQASKHSAAKAALRRQLEQTLLQIPPPRPPLADWRVIPNVNSMDFMMLVGLDEIVDMILECDGKPTLKRILTDMLPDNPIVCDQCGMDFSPLWKNRGMEKLSGVLCEKCSLANTKKDLKAEHTSRLKSAFLKALKQEQEIEEKIKAGEDVYIGSPPLQDKDVSASAITHHKPQGHVHSVHQPYKHSKGQKATDHHHQVVHHHHHGVVQHYPHHTSLVHQLHQQHIQQQQVDYDPGTSSSRRNARWHPYAPSHHHSSSHVHGVPHHRTYSGSSSGRTDGRHEYYVVHHPQHSSSSTRWGH